MHKFLVYSLDTGRVLRTGTTGAIDHIDIQARQSEAVEVDYPDGVQANGRWLRTADGYYYEQPIPAAVSPAGPIGLDTDARCARANQRQMAGLSPSLARHHHYVHLARRGCLARTAVTKGAFP